MAFVYLCNRQLNKDCDKSECVDNGGECFCTVDAGMAKKNACGEPICVVLVLSEDLIVNKSEQGKGVRIMSFPIELKDTCEDMLSEDYKVRFYAEFWQTYIRYEKLKNFCDKIEAAERTGKTPCPQHDVPLDILREQQKYMGMYLHTLQLRAIIEKIDLGLHIKSNDTCFQ